MEAPVEVGDPHGENGTGLVHLVDAGLVGEGIVGVAPGRRVVEVEQRLSDAEEQQPDTDTGREQHREPGEGAELRLAVVVAQLDAPETAEHQVEAGEEHDDERAHVVPVERVLDPSADRRIDAVGDVHEEGREQDECRNHALGRDAHAGVQPLPETPVRDVLRRVVWHRPHPYRSTHMRTRPGRNSGPGRAAKITPLRLMRSQSGARLPPGHPSTSKFLQRGRERNRR